MNQAHNNDDVDVDKTVRTTTTTSSVTSSTNTTNKNVCSSRFHLPIQVLRSNHLKDCSQQEQQQRPRKMSALRLCTDVVDKVWTDRGNRRGLYTGTMDAVTHVPHGKGVMYYQNGSVYDGSWYDGDWSGFGKFQDTTKAGATYQGLFLDNVKHGVFVVHYDDGRLYDGSFDMDRIGRGFMELPGIGRYYGDFDAEERPHGRGKLHFEDGSEYDGEFLHGQIDGHGRMIYRENTDSSSSSSTSSSGYSFYLGTFSIGKRQGQGILMVEKKVIHDGRWHDDEPIHAPAQAPGAIWVPRKKQRRCLGPIPKDLTPKSRFTHQRAAKEDKKKGKKNKVTHNQRARRGRDKEVVSNMSQ